MSEWNLDEIRADNMTSVCSVTETRRPSDRPRCKHCGYRLGTEDHRLHCGEDMPGEKRALRRSE